MGNRILSEDPDPCMMATPGINKAQSPEPRETISGNFTHLSIPLCRTVHLIVHDQVEISANQNLTMTGI